jgi:hypothetical protein
VECSRSALGGPGDAGDSSVAGDSGAPGLEAGGRGQAAGGGWRLESREWEVSGV